MMARSPLLLVLAVLMWLPLCWLLVLLSLSER
jgi:hypothetical protein